MPDPATPVHTDDPFERMSTAVFSDRLADFGTAHEWIRSLHAQYANRPRHEADTTGIVQHYFNLAWWRTRVLNALLVPGPGMPRHEGETLYQLVRELRLYVPSTLRPALRAGLGDGELYAQVMAGQGTRLADYPQYHRRAGPGRDLPIPVNHDSRWPFSRWKTLPEFTEYEISDTGVSFRGLTFQPGDVLLTNVNRPGNGVYTCLTDPPAVSSHSGFFAVIEDDGKRYPSVMETYAFGVRPVPLNVFLSPSFAYYTEVYRHRDIDARHADTINHTARDLCDNVKGYNFDTDDPDRNYVSCTSVGRIMHTDAGVVPARTRSTVGDPRVRENLLKTGYSNPTYMTPVDYLVDEHFSCTGWIDNNLFAPMIAGELVYRGFRRAMRDRTIDKGHYPLQSHLNAWAIQQVRRGTLLAPLITLFSGFDNTSLPKGPDSVLAMITVVEEQLARAIRRVHKSIAPRLERYPYTDVSQVLDDPEIQREVDAQLRIRWLR